MSTETRPVQTPELTPVLHVKKARALIDFAIQAFGASELYSLTDPASGRVIHAEISIGSHKLMIVEEKGSRNPSPESLGGTTASLCLMVENVDEATQRARAAGAKISLEPADYYYGYRCANLVDPAGHLWMLATQTEVLTPEEMQSRLNRRCGA